MLKSKIGRRQDQSTQGTPSLGACGQRGQVEARREKNWKERKETDTEGGEDKFFELNMKIILKKFNLHAIPKYLSIISKS